MLHNFRPPSINNAATLLRLLTISLLVCPCLAHCQTETQPQTQQTLPQTVEDALHQMFDAAGIIFAGEVTAIRTRAGENGASGIVEIDFRVDQAIRGCAAGSTYTLHEWSGLWAGGTPRYLPGQRLLIFLHQPGPTGITSPVGGPTGIIPIRGTSSSPQAVSSSTTSTPLIADLRWVGTLLQRPSVPTEPLVTAAAAQPASVADTSTATQQSPLSVVLEMLASWQKP